jgi:aryl-alcohol dehydrogenase-like predicted oxidoreductase
MEYRKLPGTSLELSLVCLGTMQFGGQTSEADSLSIMDYAFEHGINIFDTANSYIDGEGEKVVGKGLKGRRDKIILATKVGGQVGKGPNSSGLCRRYIMASVDASLKRLGTDYIDIYYMHVPDYDTGLEETLETMNTLVKAGKIRYIAVSNYASWQMADMLAICEKHGYVPVMVCQNVYNLLNRGVEPELIPFLKAHNIGMFAYNPIAGGFLTGKYSPGVPAQGTRFSDTHNQAKRYQERYWTDENFAAVEKLKKIAGENGMSILQLAMKWCAQQRMITSLLNGVSRLSQLEQNIASLEGEPLSKEILKQCDEVWVSLAGNVFAYNR